MTGKIGSALQVAAHGGHQNSVKTLLERGADINFRGDHGNALQASAYHRHAEMVKILLDHGADVNYKGYYYWGNALQGAAKFGRRR